MLTVTALYQRLREHLAHLRLPDATEARRLASRTHFACLSAGYTLADYDYSAPPGVDEALIRDLASLRFLDEAANVLFIGPPGVGKTISSGSSTGV